MDNTSFDEGFAGNATSAGNINRERKKGVVLLCPNLSQLEHHMAGIRKWV